MNLQSWKRIAACWVALLAVSANAAGDVTKTRTLVATLASDSAQVFEKARACQELGIIGTSEAVPALAALLANEPLAHYAREALEAMADPAADAALRGALATVQGRQLVGVVNSVGMRGDAQAVAVLAKLAKRAEPAVSGAAWLALARIGGNAVVPTLREGLASSAATTRANAAEAALLLADRLSKAGQRAEAAAWYDAVRGAVLPAQLKLSGLRGALLAREEAAMPLLLETIGAAEAEVREVGLRAIRDLRAREVTPAVVQGLERFTPAVQAAVLGALVDRGDERALPAIERAAGASEVVVRVAALRALGKVGRPSSLPLLLRALARGAAPEESDAAQRSLALISGPEADAAILGALGGAEVPVRVKLIAILGERGAATAVARVLSLARESEPTVSRAAWRALASLAKPQDLPALIAGAAELKDDDTRTLADRAIYAASMKILEPEKRAEPVVRAVREARDAATRAALLRPLGAVVRAMGGNAAARDVAIAALREKDENVRTAAAKVLADWPDASVMAVLLDFLRTEPGAMQRGVVFDGAARLAGDVATGKDRTALDVMASFGALHEAAQSDEERMKVVAGLGGAKRMEAFRMLVPYLEIPAVRTEAALAIVQVAPALLGGSEAGSVRSVLQRIAENEKDADVKARAARLLRTGAPDAAKKGKAKKG